MITLDGGVQQRTELLVVIAHAFKGGGRCPKQLRGVLHLGQQIAPTTVRVRACLPCKLAHESLRGDLVQRGSQHVHSAVGVHELGDLADDLRRHFNRDSGVVRTLEVAAGEGALGLRLGLGLGGDPFW